MTDKRIFDVLDPPPCAIRGENLEGSHRLAPQNGQRPKVFNEGGLVIRRNVATDE
jgi:hypothetical protein